MDLELFVCSHQKCGRRFPDEKKLNEHMARRHAKASAVKLPQIDPQILEKQNITLQQQQQQQQKLNPWDLSKKSSAQITPQNKLSLKEFQKEESQENSIKNNTVKQVSKIQKRGVSPGLGQKQPQKLNLAKPKLLTRPSSNQKQIVQKKVDTNNQQNIQNMQQNDQNQNNDLAKIQKNAIEQQNWKNKLDFLMNNNNIQIDQNEVANIKNFTEINNSQNQQKTKNKKELVKITEKMVLQEGFEDNLEDITNLILREKNIINFDINFNFNKLQNITFLSLSHNFIEDISLICQLTSLEDLNLNYNNISDISQISKLQNLEKLFITNNKIKSISNIDSCQNLKVLCLYKNEISDFNSSLLIFGDLNELEDLDIEENPINQEINEAQQKIVQICPNLKIFNNKKLPKSLNSSQRRSNINSMQSSTTSFMNRTLQMPDKFQNNNNINLMGQSTLSISEFDKLGSTGAFSKSDEDDLAYQIAQQIKELKEDKDELLENYDEIIKDLQESQKNCEKFENNCKIFEEENIKLKVENDSLQQQIKLLKQQLSKENKDLPKDEKNQEKYILNLKEQIMNLQEEIMDLKLGQVFSDTEQNQQKEEEQELEDEKLYQSGMQGLLDQKQQQDMEDLEDFGDEEIKQLFLRNTKNINEMRMTLSSLNQVKGDKNKNNKK